VLFVQVNVFGNVGKTIGIHFPSKSCGRRPTGFHFRANRDPSTPTPKWKPGRLGTASAGFGVQDSDSGTTGFAKRQHLAERRMEIMLARINSPDYRPGRYAKVEEFASNWKEQVLAGRKRSTIRAANSHLKVHIIPHFGNRGLDEIGVEAQQVFVTKLVKTGLSRKMVLNVLSTFSSMLETAKSWGYVCQQIAYANLVLPCDEVKREARFFTLEQVGKIIAVAPEPGFGKVTRKNVVPDAESSHFGQRSCGGKTCKPCRARFRVGRWSTRSGSTRSKPSTPLAKLSACLSIVSNNLGNLLLVQN
jgi:hypothetical protein